MCVTAVACNSTMGKGRSWRMGKGRYSVGTDLHGGSYVENDRDP